MNYSKYATNLIRNKKTITFDLLRGGDDYELIFTTSSKNDIKINQIAKSNRCKITKVGRIIDKDGIFIGGKKLSNSANFFQYNF